MQKIFYSVNEASAAVGMSRWWVHQKMKAGALPFKKVGRRTLIAHDDLEALLETFPTQKLSENVQS